MKGKKSIRRKEIFITNLGLNCLMPVLVWKRFYVGGGCLLGKENLKRTLAVLLGRLRDSGDGQRRPLSPWPELKNIRKLGGTANFSYSRSFPDHVKYNCGNWG